VCLVGWLAFPDDRLVNEAMIGGNVRLYVTPRISIGPEVTFVQGEGHSHTMITGNITWDMERPATRVIPFLVAGAEARVGWELDVRMNAFLGVRLLGA
jgi:hypothetical protein